MKEPNLEATIEFLYEAGLDMSQHEGEDETVIDHIFQTKKNTTKELEQLLYYCQKKNAASVVDYITNNCSDEKKKKVISSLISIYPISKDIIIKMLNLSRISPAEFIEIFDINQQLITYVKNSLETIRGNSTGDNIEFKIYKKEIEDVNGKISKLNTNIKELQGEKDKLIGVNKKHQEKFNEMKSLEEEIKNLRELEIGRIDQEIAQKKEERDLLQAQKKEKEKERKGLEEEIKKINDFLQSKEKTSDSDEKYEEALEALAQCVKALG